MSQFNVSQMVCIQKQRTAFKLYSFVKLIGMTLFITNLAVSSVAEAKRKNLLKVNLEAEGEILNFSFESSSPITLDQIMVERDLPNRLKITIGGHKCSRGWQKKWRAKGLNRALLYPSKKAKQRCFLKVKMKRKITDSQVSAIQKIVVDDGVLLKFSWDPSLLNPKKNEEQQASGEDLLNIPIVEEVKAVKTDPSVLEEEVEPKPSIEKEEALAVKETIEEPTSVPILEEVTVGDFPSSEVPKDHLGMQERPHNVLETVMIGQIEKARAYSPAPIILSTPISVEGDDHSNKDEVFLSKASVLLTKLLDREALTRGGGIWIMDEDLRSQVKALNTNIPKLSLSQERLVATHVGANLISRTMLNLQSLNEGQTNISLSVSMAPVSEEGTYQDIDPGVYRVEHNLSRALIEEALNQTWVEESRSQAILRSVLLPGWGHLYRGEKRLGATYLSMSMSLAVGAILSAGLGYMATQDYENNDPSSAHRRNDANAHYDRANLLWMGVGALYVTSLIDTLISAKDRSYLDVDRLNWDQARRSLEEKRGTQ